MAVSVTRGGAGLKLHHKGGWVIVALRCETDAEAAALHGRLAAEAAAARVRVTVEGGDPAGGADAARGTPPFPVF